MQNTTERRDVYSRITAQIVEYLEKGVRPWIRPWNAEHATGRISRPLRHNSQPYSGINVLSLWMSEHDDRTGEDVEREIPSMKGYTVFNVEQIEGLPEISTQRPARR